MIGKKGFVGVPVLLGADNSPRSTTVHHSAADQIDPGDPPLKLTPSRALTILPIDMIGYIPS
jgi:hypothetical protein